MSQQDRTSDIVVNHRTLKQVVDWLLVPSLFASMKARGDASWKPRMLAVAALLWACGTTTDTLVDRFTLGRKIVSRVFRWHTAPGQTYQGFIKMLRKKHAELMLAIRPHIQTQMKEVLPGQWDVAGFVVFAADGSRIEVPRTQSLEKVYSAKKKKKKGKKNRASKARCKTRKHPSKTVQNKTQSTESKRKKAESPQMWLTLLWHVGSELPWTWKTGPSDSSERGHLQAMLAELPEGSLITADAGFVGYDFWKAILENGHHFLARVGANVSLLKKLGCARQHEHTVYLWPDSAAKKNLPPLVLRLIVVHNGKHPVYLVTNLTKARLSDRQAATLYEKRWGIELFFRSFKQTFGLRKLRSRSSKNAHLELDWSLLGLWCVCLLGQRELAASGSDPKRLSPAAALRALRMTINQWRVSPESSKESFWNLLREAIRDDHQRSSSKTSRNYPRKKNRKQIGKPKINAATKKQINAAKQLAPIQHELRFTA